MRRAAIWGLVFLLCPQLSAQEKPDSRFSHKGVKASIGLGGFNNTLEQFGGQLEEGSAVSIGLGWGFNDNFTL